jgi:hypothetical protein
MIRLSFALAAVLFMAQGVVAQSSTPSSKAEATARDWSGQRLRVLFLWLYNRSQGNR